MCYKTPPPHSLSLSNFYIHTCIWWIYRIYIHMYVYIYICKSYWCVFSPQWSLSSQPWDNRRKWTTTGSYSHSFYIYNATVIKDNSFSDRPTESGPMGGQTFFLEKCGPKIANQSWRKPQEFLLIMCLASCHSHTYRVRQKISRNKSKSILYTYG